MTAAVVALTTAAAALAWPGRPDPAARLRSLRARVERAGPADPTGPARRPRLLLSVAVVGILALLTVGVSPWLALPVLAAAVVARRRRTRRADHAAELPLVIDLFASCLAAGAAVPTALEAAGAAAGEVLRARIVAVAEELRTGAPAAEAWGPWLTDGSLAAVARTCVRATGTGSGAAAELGRTAARLRAQRRSHTQERAARMSVWVVLPVAFCFLPAFVLVGVVPVAVGLLARLH